MSDLEGTPEEAAGGLLADDPDEKLAEICGVLNAYHAKLVAHVAGRLERDEWQGHRIHSPTQWVAWKTGLSPSRAKQIVQMAERRASFPAVTEAFERGELAVDQVDVVVSRAPAWADAQVVEYAATTTVHQLRCTMRDRFFTPDPDEANAESDGSEPEEAPVDRDRLSTGVTDDHRWRINGELGLDDGGIVDAALREAKDSLFERGNIDATWADALVEVARRSLDSVESPARRDRFRTWFHLDVTDGAMTNTGGWRLPDTVRDHLLCDGVVQPVWEQEGLPTSVGRTQRIVPDRTRRVIERRDRGCRVPGCTATRFVEIHHIIHWLDGGPTDTWNLVSLCPKHHRLHHQGGLGIKGDADAEDGLLFTDDRGNVIERCGRPRPPTDPPEVPAGRYLHPTGERLDMRWLGDNWIHPDELRRRREAAAPLEPKPDEIS
ncbi:MAG: DUF222 domain-containing protein [Ilumatobacter sp.]|uniref:HNH endonuclease signature motif containing protein n=1 Tax=Ilumatobacter sp. TaxID=1967498 RepID=UPI002613D11A|nr:HNH endonuclease signature motif containing protein [Ilumatobacter sp.]MDJ0767866.1 DUF222 domain-containing protein [Ilumatobacter sp.]